MKLKKQKGGFLSILLATLGATLLGNISAGKGINRAWKGIVRAGYGNKRQNYEKQMDFHCRLNLQLTLKYKNIIKMKLDLRCLFKR